MTTGMIILAMGIAVAILAFALTIVWCVTGKGQKAKIKEYLKEWY